MLYTGLKLRSCRGLWNKANKQWRSHGNLRDPDMSMSIPGTDRVNKASPCGVHGMDAEHVRNMVSPNEGNEVTRDAFQEVRAT